MSRAVRGRSPSLVNATRRRQARRARALFAVAGGSLFCSSIAFADNYTWIAPPGTQSFATPGNWNPAGPPGPNDIPVFNLNQANTVEFAGDHSGIALEVLQGTLTFQPDAGAIPVQRNLSFLIDSFINGGSLTLAGTTGPPQRQMNLSLAENLFVGGDSFSAGAASGLTLSAESKVNVGLNLKLWAGSTLTLGGGTLGVGTFDHSGGGSFNFTGGTLHAGTFLGNLTNSGGRIAPGTSVGVTRITGNLQMNSGAIEIELGGFTPGTDNDQLQVSGSVSFGSSQVAIRTLSGFTPLPGDVFEVVTFSSATGEPTVVNESSLPGLTFDPIVTANSLALRAEALFAGDADLNGLVDVRDLLALANNWLNNSNWLGGDFDGNGFVDKADLTLLAQNWQAGVNADPFEGAAASLGLSGANVPEPTAFALLLGIIPIRRRRP